jgi:hypothetical protein
MASKGFAPTSLVTVWFVWLMIWIVWMMLLSWDHDVGKDSHGTLLAPERLREGQFGTLNRGSVREARHVRVSKVDFAGHLSSALAPVAGRTDRT